MTEKKRKSEGIWCTSCGRALPKDSVYCEFCGAEVEKEIGHERQKQWYSRLWNWAERKWKCSIGICLGAVLCLFFLFLVIPRGEEKKISGFLGYVKDNSLFLLDRKEKAQELTDYYLGDWKEREKARLPYDSSCVPVRSEDGKTLWYPEKIGDSSFSLMRRQYDSKKEQKLDSGVVSFQASGQYAVYEKNNTGLYIYGEKGKEKLSAGILSYQLSDSGDYVLWLEENEGNSSNLYGRNLSEKNGKDKEKILLDKNLSFLGASKDLRLILYKKEGDLWLLRDHSKKKRLIQDVSQVFLPEDEQNSLYFTREENGEEALYALNDIDTKEKLIDSEFQFLIHSKDDLLFYKASGETGEELRIAYRGNRASLDCDPNEKFQVFVSQDSAWYTAPPEAGLEPSLYRVSLRPNSFGKTEETAEMADVYCGVLEGEPLYLKNSRGQTGDLYLGEERVAYDVLAGSVKVTSEGNRAFCLSDYDTQAASGVLTEIGRGRTETVEENVSGYAMISDEELLYYTDYEPLRGRGTLNLKRGEKREIVDTDVWAAFTEESQGTGAMRQTQVR